MDVEETFWNPLRTVHAMSQTRCSRPNRKARFQEQSAGGPRMPQCILFAASSSMIVAAGCLAALFRSDQVPTCTVNRERAASAAMGKIELQVVYVCFCHFHKEADKTPSRLFSSPSSRPRRIFAAMRASQSSYRQSPAYPRAQRREKRGRRAGRSAWIRPNAAAASSPYMQV